MEKIISITEYLEKDEDDYFEFEGYSIKTTEQEIKLLIQNGRSCCETSGYFFTNDKPDYFIDASLLNITLTDTALNTTELDKRDIDLSYGGDIMFVNIETDKGTLQFTAYNEHNGYYGHEAKVISTQLQHTQDL